MIDAVETKKGKNMLLKGAHILMRKITCRHVYIEGIFSINGGKGQREGINRGLGHRERKVSCGRFELIWSRGVGHD